MFLCFSADSHFSLSLNGSTLLTDSGQTLSSCGIVSGDLICVVLPESTAESDGSAAARTTGDSDNQNQQVQQVQQVQQAAMTSNEVREWTRRQPPLL